MDRKLHLASWDFGQIVWQGDSIPSTAASTIHIHGMAEQQIRHSAQRHDSSLAQMQCIIYATP
jgi:hypothetical protein